MRQSNPKFHPDTIHDTGCGRGCVKATECPYPVCLREPGAAFEHRRTEFLKAMQPGETVLAAAKRLGLNYRTACRYTKGSP